MSSCIAISRCIGHGIKREGARRFDSPLSK
jgi:hypothetical protein